LRGDFVELLPAVLAGRSERAPTVVFQTAVLPYVSDDRRSRLQETLESAGVAGAVAFVSAGRPRDDEDTWGLRITYWPGGEREFAGHADYHGAWLDWELV
jgi:hypothetical protein